MSYRESGDHLPEKVPTSCYELGNELETLSWVSKALNLTDRIPSCPRKDTLRNALAAMLEDKHLLSYHELQCELQKAQHASVDMKNEMDLLKAQLKDYSDDNPEIFELVKAEPELTDNEGNLRFRLISKRGYRIWKWFTMITVIIMILLIWRYFQ